MNSYIQEYEKLTFADDFMFGAVMENKDIAKRIIEVILNDKIPNIESCELQKTVKNAVNSHGVRYDVYIKTEDEKKVYDVEMQTSNTGNLAKRGRYYLSSSDMDFLKSGADYEALPESFVVFICTEQLDEFKTNQAVYDFIRGNADGTVLNDMTHLVFVNTHGCTERKELSVLMEYINTGKPNDELTQGIDNKVQEVRQDEKLYSSYIKERINENRLIAKGRVEGIAEGQAELMQRLLDNGKSVKEIAGLLSMTEDEVKAILDTKSE